MCLCFSFVLILGALSARTGAAIAQGVQKVAHELILSYTNIKDAAGRLSAPPTHPSTQGNGEILKQATEAFAPMCCCGPPVRQRDNSRRT